MAETEKNFPGLLHPLSMMRRARGLSALDHQVLEPGDLPQPYRQLLDHQGDMTSRLESAYRTSIQVRRLHSSNDGKNYFREVILETIGSIPRPVEYGAIEIQLAQLPEAAKQAVIDAQIPLGAILNKGRIPYDCSLRGFFKVIPDQSILEAFGIEESIPLFGRSNRIETRTGGIIAQIVEILPPV
ncbi:MAG: hypothetical protein VW907_06540 [Opitutae bacterium]